MAKQEKGKNKKEQTQKEDKSLDIDFGVGKISLGGIFGGIEKLVDLAAKLKESGGEINKEGEINLDTLKKGMKGVYGFSVKTAVGGEPVVETFGNIKKTPTGPKVDEEREPLVDVFDEKDEIRIYAEMPGVNEKDIKITLKEDILDISAQGQVRKYYKAIKLPVKVKTKTFSHHYTNGIVEVKIKK